MAIAFRAKSGIDENSSSFTLSKPTGTLSTDVLIASVAWAGSAVTLTPPSGWTPITTNPLTNSSMRSGAFWSLGSNTNLTFTLSGACDNGYVCAAFSGVDNTTPIDATGTTSTSSGSQSLTSNSVTTVTANALEVVALAPWNGPASPTSTGWTVQVSSATIAHEEADLGYRALTAAGATGTTAWSFAGQAATGQLLSAIPFALRPASAGGATIYPAAALCFGC